MAANFNLSFDSEEDNSIFITQEPKPTSGVKVHNQAVENIDLESAMVTTEDSGNDSDILDMEIPEHVDYGISQEKVAKYIPEVENISSEE